MKLAYFVHDLTDPAVRRRVRMLQAGGAEPVVLGFRRAEIAPEDIEGAPAVDLGRTYDARLGHRARVTALAALGAGRFRELLQGSQAVMARSLEMLAVASAARRACGLAGPLVYECLDIHRIMVGEGAKSRVMRAAERALLRHADLLVVSSPAFLQAYFEPRQGLGSRLNLRTLLVENKLLELGPATAAPPEPPAAPGRPWRIGWMGAIRCRKSLDILEQLAERRPDLVDVVIHGRPAYSEFDDFDGRTRRLPNLRFAGPYRAEDLAGLYGQVHFAWGLDYMEEGLNSAWLLPNRLYEASRFGVVPIALSGVETGRYLARGGFGLRIDDPAELEQVLEAMTPESYARLRDQVAAQPQAAFVAGEADCRALVDAVFARPAAPRGEELRASTAELAA